MNRNELEDAISRHICKSRYQGSWDEAPPFFKASISRDTKAALTALEAIMERDGLKLTGSKAEDNMHKAGMDERRIQDQMNQRDNIIIDTSEIWKAMHDQAKCKLKGHVEPKEQSNG